MSHDIVLLAICLAAAAFGLLSATLAFVDIRENRNYTRCKGRVTKVEHKKDRRQKTIDIGVTYSIYDEIEFGILKAKRRKANLADRLPILVDEVTDHIKEDNGLAACAVLSGIISAELTTAGLFVHTILRAL